MWPTSFVPSASQAEIDASDRAVEVVAGLSKRLNVTVCGSAFGPPPARAARGLAGTSLPTNRAHVLQPDGEHAGYDKVHLFSPTAENLAFSPGDDPPPVVEIDRSGVRLSPLICYDLRFPDVSRAAFRGGAEVLAVSAQWPEVRRPHWNALIRGRAAEFEGFVIACNRTGTDEIGRRKMRLAFDGGMSGVIAPNGEAIEAVTEESLQADGREPTCLRTYEIDLDDARELRRAVPVLRDERIDVISRWNQK